MRKTVKKSISILLALVALLSMIPAFSIAAEDDEADVDEALAALTLGATAVVTEDLVLPAEGLNETEIAWASGNTAFLWDDGTVLRPPTGADVTVVLTATVSKGEVSKDKAFNIGIPAYVIGGRAILNVFTAPKGESFEDGLPIDVPVRSCPKLPYRVWVEYTDGHAEWRNTQWPWSGSYGYGPRDSSGAYGPGTVAQIEQIWQGTPVGGEYSVTGWITGDNTTTLGYPITVNCTVVEGDFTMPQVNGIYRGNNSTFTDIPANPAGFAVPEKMTKTLPITKVYLTTDNQNRLTSNVTRSVTQAATASIWEVSRWLFNFRRTCGLPTTGYTQPGGWESPTTYLRGHGTGHYINALALTYNTGAGTDEDRAAILVKIKRYLTEARTYQEMTFWPLEWVGQAVGEKYEDVLAAGKTWKDLDVTRWREASDTWPYNEADKAANAPDWPLPVLNSSAITQNWNSRTNANYIANDDPKWFGYGYLNAIEPLHPILGERYGTYSAWLWAPYYSIHKQLAGYMDCYYSFKDNEDPELKALADLSLLICKDMSRWISNRLTEKCFIGDRVLTTLINPKVPGNSTYGNMNYQWYTNIGGEYGGCNESMARCALELDKDDPDRKLILEGVKMFYNKSYWDTLAANSENMALNGNSHANSRIPNFPGALQQNLLEPDPYLYVISKNFLDFNAGRFRYYGGNVGNGEWYRAPYTQIANIGTTINETCCAMNLAKLAKELATYDPDNAEYMDYYERLTFNQLIGSVRQAGGTWGVTYQYPVGPNSSKSFGNTDPGANCCGGTGVENPSRYIESVYFANEDAVWVNMMMQVHGVLDYTGYTIHQDCSFPAEASTITMTPNEGQTQKPTAMHIRIPWWANKDVSVKLNGVEVADEYLASSFVVIPARLWSETDKVELSMPFHLSIDYGPDKSGAAATGYYWAGTIFLGPLAMTGTGAWSVQTINSDLSNIRVNAPFDLPDSAENTPGNNVNIYTANLLASAEGPQANTFAATLQPDYHRDSSTTKYFRIQLAATEAGVNRIALYSKILEAAEFDPALFTEASFAAMQAVLAATIALYQDAEAVQSAVDAQLAALQAAIDVMVPTQEGKAALLALIGEAEALQAAQLAWVDAYGEDFDAAWAALMADPGNAALGNAARDLVEPLDEFAGRPAAPYGFARIIAQIPQAQAAYDDDAISLAGINAAYAALSKPLLEVRPGYMPEPEDVEDLGLAALLVEANGYKEEDYRPATFEPLPQAILEAEERVNAIVAGSSTIHIADIPYALFTLKAAIDGLVIVHDDLDHLERVIIVPPTRLEEGVYNIRCAICGEVHEEGPIAKLVIAGASTAPAKFVSMVETAKNSRQWVLTFTVTLTLAGEVPGTEDVKYSITLAGNNANLDGTYKFGKGHDLDGYTLTYDVKGNGSNIKALSLKK